MPLVGSAVRYIRYPRWTYQEPVVREGFSLRLAELTSETYHRGIFLPGSPTINSKSRAGKASTW